MSIRGRSPIFRKQAAIIDPSFHRLVIFDMDGVVTQTADIHAGAWKKTFDEFLELYCQKKGCQYQPFDIHWDYRCYVDGKTRCDGAQSFLESRHIYLPIGEPSDSPESETIFGISNKKNIIFHQLLHQHGVKVYQSTIQFIQALKENNIQVAIISASKNATEVLETAGVLKLFDTKVDGVDVERLGLKGKPEPDIFLEAAKRLGCSPSESVVVEDALAGVQAGEAGHFVLVIGLDRENQFHLLKSHGANIVVNDLAEVKILSKAVPIQKKVTPWLLVYENYDPQEEGLRETLCTLGNGYIATRGATIESKDDGIHYPGTYLAGGYNRVQYKIADQCTTNEDLANFPNWLSLNFKIQNGEWFNLDQVQILTYRQILNLKHGVLHRKILFRDGQGHETLVKERRFVHMSDFHMAGLEVTIQALNWQGKLTVRTALNGHVRNNNIKNDPSYQASHLRTIHNQEVDQESITLKVETRQSELRMAQAARTRFFQNDQLLETPRNLVQENDLIAQDCELEMANDTITIEKIVSIYTSRDNAISECGLEAIRAIHRAPEFKQLISSHQKAWKHLWKNFDIEIKTHMIEKKDLTQLAAHLHTFHLLQSMSPNSIDLDVDVPARGWHGEAYRGHVFWDNIFVFPFFNLRMPLITESLIKYRYRRLNEARLLAKEAGYQGAMYPWQSGSNGEEETQRFLYISQNSQWVPDLTHLQRHLNAAIVYNIWSYYQVTADIEFMYRYGAEIILEIARFWASLAIHNPDLDRFEIHGVVGPDEYHTHYPGNPQAGINNNAYTNVMAVWCLCRALEVLSLLPKIRREEIIDKINLKTNEMLHWNEISRKMKVPFGDNGIINQFDGFENLSEFPWKAYRDQYGSFQYLEDWVSAEGEALENYKIIKQADVLMLFYLFSTETLVELFNRLNYDFRTESIPLNIDYYTRRTVHGSSLSRVANAWVLARANRKRSWNLFQEALINDLDDMQGGTTAGGIHLGAMAGTIDLLQRCYTGLELREGILWFNPLLPKPLKHMVFHCNYRENLLKIEIKQEELTIQASVCHAKKIKIGVLGASHILQAGETKTFPLQGQ